MNDTSDEHETAQPLASPPGPPDRELREQLVKILKQLQLDSMGVDTDLPSEDNVATLIDYLHWAEVQIEQMYASQATALLQRVRDSLSENHRLRHMNDPQSALDYSTGWREAIEEVRLVLDNIIGEKDASS